MRATSDAARTRFSSATASAMRRISSQPLRFDIGAWSLPHPRKTNGGEDSHFVSPSSSQTAWLGVADGVSAANDGGLYAHKLMRHAAELISTSSDTDPSAILQRAWTSAQSIDGRSTACIASLTGSRLRWVNLGDGGCWILRRLPSSRLGIAFKTRPQLWEWNCPLQLGRLDGVELNTPADANTGEQALLPGDVVLLATDGCFDALHPLEVLQLTARDLEAPDVSAMRVATTLVEMAIELSKDSTRMSPVAHAMEREGFVARSRELQDDVTVAVARVLPAGSSERFAL